MALIDRESLLEKFQFRIEPCGVEGETIKKCVEMARDIVLAEPVVKDINVPSWIPVTERLPEKMGQFVCRYVFGENTEYPFFQVLWYFANLENPHFQHEGSMGLTVTHWMPLPEPPKED